MRPAAFAVEVAALGYTCQQNSGREKAVFLIELSTFSQIVAVVSVYKKVVNPFVSAIRVEFCQNLFPPEKVRMF